MRVAILLILLGTSTLAMPADKDATPIGGGRFMLTGRSVTVFGTSGKVIEKLVVQANAFCNRTAGVGAEILETSGSEAEPGEVNNTGNLKRAGKAALGTIVFTCGAPSAEPAPSKDDVYTQIGKLKALLDSGAITQQEYDEQKNKLLGK